jgi:hypothetical protein
MRHSLQRHRGQQHRQLMSPSQDGDAGIDVAHVD